MATRRISRALSLATAAALSITTIALVPGTGAADPNVSIEEVQQRVDALYDEAEEATERAHTITLEVDDAQRRLDRLRADITKQEREFEAAARGARPHAASDMYATGGIDPSMQMMLSTDPDDFLLQAQSLDQVLRSQDADLRRAEVAQLALEQAKTRADQELARLSDLQAAGPEGARRSERQARRGPGAALTPEGRGARAARRACRPSAPRTRQPQLARPPRQRPHHRPRVVRQRSRRVSGGLRPGPGRQGLRLRRLRPGRLRLLRAHDVRLGAAPASRCRTRRPPSTASPRGSTPAACSRATWSSSTAASPTSASTSAAA